MNTVILTKVKVKSINDASLTTRLSNNLMGDAFRLGGVYVCVELHDEIIETIFSWEELNDVVLTLGGEVTSFRFRRSIFGHGTHFSRY